MSERYCLEDSVTSHAGLLQAVERELADMPQIERLDEYIHFLDQLKVMRVRSAEYIPARFAMEFALLLRLNEYDEKIGMPPCEMPLGNGSGGLVDFSPVPAAWLSDR